MYKLYATSREQLLSLGASGVLRFTYLLKKKLSMTGALPEVSITASDGTPLTQDVYKTLPREKSVTISAPFDGKVLHLRNGKIQSVSWITVDQLIMVDHLTFGSELRVFQGCDCIQTIRFERENAKENMATTDFELAKRLRSVHGDMIAVSHSIGVIGAKLNQYPQTRQWIYTALRQGVMPRAAYQILMNFTQKNGGRNH